MSRNTKRISSVALLALVLLAFGACKGDSPTAPPPGTTPPGNTPPPSGVTLVVTTSNVDPLVDSTVVITATVTENGQPVPNGTAVEFQTTNGTFTDTNATSTVRTTTNGVATATLTSSTAGLSRTSITVNNVTRTVDVTFRARPVTNPPPTTTPTITSVTPSIGRPAGGETIRITGTNFTAPVRVLFDTGTGSPVEGFVVNRTDTTIDVITPAVNLGAGQQLISSIIVITAAGTTSEQRAEVASGFTYRNESLTPVIHTLTPNSSPIEGGTRVSIFGEGFQAPVQVLFGSAEARIIETRFSEIIVEAPAARDTNPNGSGTVTGPVAVTVRNINSNTQVSVGDRFRYISKMQITTVKPVVGSSLGNTEVIIDGTGFDSPLDVQIAGVQAQVLEVSGTRLRVRTGRLPQTCSSATGPITVTNTANGDTDTYGDAANEAGFTYNAVQASIIGIAGTLAPGGVVSVTVRNPGIGPNGEGTPRFTIAGRTLIPAPSINTDPIGPTTFTFTLPTTGFTFPTVACTTGGSEPGTQLGPTETNLVYTNAVAGCSDTISVTIQPPTPNPCLTEPQPIVTDPAVGCATAPATTVAGPATTANITIQNDTEAQTLNITNATISGPNGSEFSITPTSSLNIPAGGSRSFTVTFDPTTAGLGKQATVTFSTNSSSRPTVTVCLRGDANPLSLSPDLNRRTAPSVGRFASRAVRIQVPRWLSRRRTQRSKSCDSRSNSTRRAAFSIRWPRSCAKQGRSARPNRSSAPA